MRLRRLLAAVAALSVLPIAAAGADAAMTFTPCSPSGFSCGELTVPLDHSGQAPGTLVLHAKRRVAAANATNTAIIPLAGGPGQAALPVSADFATLLGSALDTHDLLVFDQRGTGTSNRLSCSAFQDSGPMAAIIARCADELGPARAYYRTADSVEDIEALRVAAGYERLVLLGVSYGTKVALDYAAKYPTHVEALVLDSVVPPEGSDVFNRSTFAAIRPVLTELCSRGACRGITTDVRTDLSRLVAALRRTPIRGLVDRGGGVRLPVILGTDGLLTVLLAGDLNPSLRAELPAAMRSALHHDSKPLLRLAVRAVGLTGFPTTAIGPSVVHGALEDTADSDALFVATRCEESVFPWTRTASAGERKASALAAARLLSASFRPFGYLVALDSEAIPICLGWPETSPAPVDQVPLPPVPTLIFGGGADLRTPLSDDRAVAARIPGAQVVSVPFTGHSVLGSDFSGCAAAALAAFFAHRPVGSCAAVRQTFAPVDVAPMRLADVPGRTRAAKAIMAVQATVLDVRRQFIGDALAAGREPPVGARVPGLRSGAALWTQAGIRFQRVEYVPGVVVSGLRPHRRPARSVYTVSGSAGVNGQVTLYSDGRIVARLAGARSVVTMARAASASRDDGLPEQLPRYARLTRLSR